MAGVRRTILVTVLVALGSAVSAAPAAASPEFTISWNRDQVAGIREGIARGDGLCDAVALAAGTGVGIATAGAPLVAGAAVGTGVGAVGLLCGRNDPKLRDAIDEAYWRKCGVDAYFTDGPLSYDARYRYVVCP
jgi:hypothetical protein